MLRRVLLAGVAVAALACLLVAGIQRNAMGGLTRPVFRAVTDRSLHLDAFRPFGFDNAYLWLGMALALTVSALVLAALPRVALLRSRLVPVALVLVALIAAGFAQVQRDSIRAIGYGVNAVFVGDDGTNHSAGAVGPIFDPFNWRSPYLALGLAVGLLVGAAVVGVSRRSFHVGVARSASPG